jgi:hypothetical protein
VERKPKDVEHFIYDTRLKRSDLRHLFDILRSGSSEDVDIEIDKFTSLSIDELVTYEDEIREITFTRRKPRVILSIGESRVFIAGDSDDASAGIAARLKDVFSERTLSIWKRLSERRISYLAAALIVLGTIVSIFALGVMGQKALPYIAVVAMPLVLLVGMAFVSASQYYSARNNPIKFRPEKGTPVNWRGRTWEVTKLLLPYVIGVASGLTLDRLRERPAPVTPICEPRSQLPSAPDPSTERK